MISIFPGFYRYLKSISKSVSSLGVYALIFIFFFLDYFSLLVVRSLLLFINVRARKTNETGGSQNIEYFGNDLTRIHKRQEKVYTFFYFPRAA